MQKSIRPFRFIYSISCKLCICRAYRLLTVQTLCIFPRFALINRNEGNLLFSADYLIRQPCGNTLRFPCSASINVHCGADSACPRSSCTSFGAAPLESRSVAEPYSREIAERERKVEETRRPAKKRTVCTARDGCRQRAGRKPSTDPTTEKDSFPRRAKILP